MILLRILEAAKAAGRWTFEHPKDAIILLLALFLACVGWRLKRERGYSQELTSKIEGLPPNTSQVVTVYRDHVITKWRDGPTKIEYRDRYLPPEGHIEVVTTVNHPENSPEVVIKDRGFTNRLGGGIVYSGEPLPLIDLKIAYWQRYSLTLGLTPRFGGGGISRHIDDFTPFSNLEIIGMGGLGWAGELRLAVGLRTSF